MFQFPPSPTVGQLFTPAPGINYRWNGTAWFPVGAASGGIKISDTEPVITTGEQWYESDTAGHYMRYQNPDGTSTLVSLAGAGGDFIPTAASTTIVPESRIINGGFAIDQRNAGAAVNVNTDATVFYSSDRWMGLASGGGAFNYQRSAAPAGFQLTAAVGTVDASLAAGDYYTVGHQIEGFNIADMQFGTAQAQSFTFACSMHSTVAGTFPVSFRSGVAPAVVYVKTVALPANAWTPVSFTVPGPTIGVWNVGNGLGMWVRIGLGNGTTYQAPAADVWQAGGFYSVAGCVNLMATAGASLVLREARLYPGSIDYGPCRRLYAEELRLCQRYFEKSYPVNVVPGTVGEDGESIFMQTVGVGGSQFSNEVRFAAPKRAKPTIVILNPVAANNQIRNIAASIDFSSTGLAMTSENNFAANAVAPAGTGVGYQCAFHWTASAEL